MIGYTMRSILLIIIFAIVNSQARTLIEHCDKFKIICGNRLKSPPPSPTTAPPTKESSPLRLFQDSDGYGRPMYPSPPPPKPARLVDAYIITSCEGDKFCTRKNYGKPAQPPPPAPKLPPPHHYQVSGGGVMVDEQSSPAIFVVSA